MNTRPATAASRQPGARKLKRSPVVLSNVNPRGCNAAVAVVSIVAPKNTPTPSVSTKASASKPGINQRRIDGGAVVWNHEVSPPAHGYTCVRIEQSEQFTQPVMTSFAMAASGRQCDEIYPTCMRREWGNNGSLFMKTRSGLTLAADLVSYGHGAVIPVDGGVLTS